MAGIVYEREAAAGTLALLDAKVAPGDLVWQVLEVATGSGTRAGVYRSRWYDLEIAGPYGASERVVCAPFIPKGAVLLLLENGIVAVRYLGVVDGGTPRLIGYHTDLRWKQPSAILPEIYRRVEGDARSWVNDRP